MDIKGLIAKAKGLARSNPDAVRTGVHKVEEVLNRRTGGKYADKVAKGAAAAENALGVPGEAKKAFVEESSAAQAPPEAVAVDPIDAPAPIDRPGSTER